MEKLKLQLKSFQHFIINFCLYKTDEKFYLVLFYFYFIFILDLSVFLIFPCLLLIHQLFEFQPSLLEIDIFL